jgi:hypothetical protein
VEEEKSLKDQPLNTFPEALSFQKARCCTGQLNVIAPGRGQSLTQQPQYQHSSGCKIIGGLPFVGLGMYTSTWHSSTQRLHPLQTFSSKITGVFGVVILGKAYISS